MKKYKTCRWSTTVECVECEKETEKTLWIRSPHYRKLQTRRKESASENYYDTWEEARDALLARCQSRIDGLRIQLMKAEGDLGNVKGMKKPEAA